jgi:autotransporter translocation and assembly factor TamB
MAERKLQSLPPLVRPAVLRGRVSVDVRLDGSIVEPKVAAAFVARSVRAPGSKDPLDLDATVVADSAGGKLAVAAKTAGRSAAGRRAGWRRTGTARQRLAEAD